MTPVQQLERIMKALANRRRLTILAHLKKNREASVGSIAAEIRLSLKATSKHMLVLRAVDIVESEQRSLLVFYRLAGNQHVAARHILSLL